MLTAYRVQNLRCIKDSGFLEIRPIVVFVGKNSSGKSTLLRLLPLIKQSVSAETREPVLWYGKSADFGSFNEAVSSFAASKEVTFTFRFLLAGSSGRDVMFSEGGERIFVPSGSRGQFFVSNEASPVGISLMLRARSGSEGTYTRAIEVSVGDDILRLVAAESGELEVPTLNDNPIPNMPPAYFRSIRGRFFPNVVPAPSPEGPGGDDSRRQQSMLFAEGPFFGALIERLKPFVHGNTKAQNLRRYANRLLFGSKAEFRKHLKEVSLQFRWKQDVLEPALNHQVETLRIATLLRHLPRMLREASSQLDELGAGVRYLEPVRARASRYYRFQELAIDQIDPQGENVPMFLSSLGFQERQSLEKWMTSAMGFNVKATKEGGHAKLLVTESDGSREVNLADTGFGYSQVLPIVLQLWKIGRDTEIMRRSMRQQVVMAVEQPELHLHPHFQALLADVFTLSVNSAKTAQVALSLVIETHSEHLVNRLGALVEGKKLSPADIAIYLVEREKTDGHATVQLATFTEEGTLSEPWPFGFFSPQLPDPK